MEFDSQPTRLQITMDFTATPTGRELARTARSMTDQLADMGLIPDDMEARIQTCGNIFHQILMDDRRKMGPASNLFDSYIRRN